MVGDLEYVHAVFVPIAEFAFYQEHWGLTHLIVAIPETMDDVDEDVDNGGVGYARRAADRCAIDIRQ